MRPQDRKVGYNGVETRVGDLPSATTRAEFGYGHFPAHIIDRGVAPGVWPFTPDTCELADDPYGIWVENDTILACQGCGLDCT